MRHCLVTLIVLVCCGVATSQAPRGGTVEVREDLLRFDHQRLEIQRTDDGWLLVAGGQPIKHFPRETEARQALKLMHDLRLTHHGTVGRPLPVIEYWLSEGEAPRGLVRGLRLTPIDPTTVRAEAVRDQWVVRDDRQMHFLFGSYEDEARRAATIIRKYGFNQVGTLGVDSPVLMYFLVYHNNRGDTQVVTPTSGGLQPAKAQSVLPEGAALPKVQGRLPRTGAKTPAALAALPTTRQLTTPNLETGASRAVQRLPFDWRTAQVRRDSGEWKLVSGNHTLAYFGRTEWEARQALTALQRYRFTEQCTVGDSGHTCSYFLTQGQAPRGLHVGVSSLAFHPEALAVVWRDGNWVVAEGTRTLFQFGESEPDAQQLLAVIQKHKFDHWCHIGRASGPGGMTFFVRAR